MTTLRALSFLKSLGFLGLGEAREPAPALPVRAPAPAAPQDRYEPGRRLDKPSIEPAFVTAALEIIAADGKEPFADVLEAYLAGRELPASFQKNEGAAIGFILEALARQTLQTLYPTGEIAHGAKLYDGAGKEVGELDGIVLDPNGQVLALAEMKISPGMVNKGRRKLVSLLQGIQDGTLTHYEAEPGQRRSFDQPGPLDRARFTGLSAEDCFGMSVREAAPAPGILRLSVSYRTIAKVASILTFYSGRQQVPPCFDSKSHPDKHAACGTQ